MTVIEDADDAIAVLQHDGSVCMKRTGRRGGGPDGRLMLPDGWDGGHAPLVWRNDVVKVHVPGTNHSVMRRWNGTFEGWYVNLELDWVRTAIGFDSLDLVLDVVTDADLGNPRLKDAEELDWSEAHGVTSPEHARVAREEAERVIALIADRGGIFGADWTRWEPDAGWRVPSLPPGWGSV